MNIQRFHQRHQKGFTLIEVMVVVVIIALAGAILVFGFEQTLNRRKGTAAEEVYQWLQAAADTAVFQSVVIGVTQKDNQLMLLAFYQDNWYKLADQEPLEINEEIDILWSDSLIDNNEFHADEFESGEETYHSPYLIVLPTGQVQPEGQISIVERKDSQQNSTEDSHVLATIVWDEIERFDLNWQQAQ